MSRLENLKQLRDFVGAVHYYHDMGLHRSHIMTPLTDQTGNTTSTYSQEMETSFKQMNIIVMARDALSIYPHNNLPFDIYTDASYYHPGA